MLLLLAAVFDDRSALHNELDTLQLGDVRGSPATAMTRPGGLCRIRASGIKIMKLAAMTASGGNILRMLFRLGTSTTKIAQATK